MHMSLIKNFQKYGNNLTELEIPYVTNVTGEYAVSYTHLTLPTT